MSACADDHLLPDTQDTQRKKHLVPETLALYQDKIHLLQGYSCNGDFIDII